MFWRCNQLAAKRLRLCTSCCVMISVHLKKLRQRIELSAEEERGICNAVAETRRVAADQVLVRSGDPLNSSLLLLDGWLDGARIFPVANAR